jgi:hypothetical protein
MATAAFAVAGNGPNGDKKKGGEDPPKAGNTVQAPKVTFQPGKGITFDGGDDFSLNLKSYFQVKWYYLALDSQSDTNSFRTKRARLNFSGHVWNRDLTYKVQTDFIDSDDTSIKDAWARYNFYNTDHYTLGMRFGTQKMFESRQGTISSQRQEFSNRALATRTFGSARSTGALFLGSGMNDDNGGKKLHWFAGIMNNDTAAGSLSADAEATNTGVGGVGDNELNYMIGLRFDPQGEMAYSEGDLEHSGKMTSSLGASVLFGNADTGVSGLGDIESTTVNLNAAIKLGDGLAASGEFFARHDDPDGGFGSADSNGFYVQGSYTMPPDNGTQYAFGARVSMIDFKDPPILMSAPGMESGQGDPIASQGGGIGNAYGPFTVGAEGDIVEYQLMASAYYHKHALKTQVTYTYQHADPDNVAGIGNDENHGVDLIFTLAF